MSAPEKAARSLIEPITESKIKSLISENYDINTSFVNPNIITAVPEKTFLEKAFLLHEIFTGGGSMIADRKLLTIGGRITKRCREL